MCESYCVSFKNEIEKSFILHWNYRNLKYCPEELLFYGKHIEDIYLKGNLICNLPNWLVQLKHLSEIHLSDNNLYDLPEEISAFTSLRVLDVSRNKICQLPRTFTALQLCCFYVNGNMLTHLPEDIGKMKSLAYLYAQNNNLKRIPDSIVQCTSLREVDFDSNELTNLPKLMVYLPNLSYLSLRKNKFRYLPAVPFHTQPIILIEPNENLTHVSYNFAIYLQLKHIPQLEDSWNFRSYRIDKVDQNTYENHVILETETKNTLVIPLKQVDHENQASAATLLELCLRKVYTMCNLKGSCNKQKNDFLLRILPKIIVEKLKSSPTAFCETCRNPLFDFALIRTFDVNTSNINHTPKMEIVQYFCNKTCAQLFDANEQLVLNLRQLRWRKITCKNEFS